ncbi:MAG: hypothetical protein ABII00_04500, partial [Elusimicrobiota bacterium]
MRGKRVIGAFLFAVVVLLNITTVRDADTWLHLKTGELIWREGIPRTDPFSFVIGGSPWITFEWLSQALFFKIFEVLGAAGLTGFVALVVGAAFLAAWSVNRDRPLWSAAVVLAAALGSRAWFIERPFVFDYLFAAGMLAAFWNVRFREPPGRLRWTLPLAVVLWANLHGGAAALGPALIALSVAAERLRDREVPLWDWAPVVLLACAGILVNPHGPGVLAHLWETMTFAGKDLLYEWHAPTSQFLGIYGLFLLGGAAALLPTVRRRPFAAAWLIAFAAASLRMQRNIPLYLLAAAPVIAGAYGPGLRTEGRRRKGK